MFSILQKSPDSVNAEDLETLQNEIERCLVQVVTKKWELDCELQALNSTSPDLNSPTPNSAGGVGTNLIVPPAAVAAAAATTATNPIGGKLRNSHRLNHIDSAENSSDGFKSSLFGSSSNCFGSASGTNSTEDSEGSEGSLISSLTSSTIITALPEPGSQNQTSNSVHNSSIKRSLKSTSDRPSKRFRQNSSNSFTSSGVHTKRPPHSKHRSKIVPSKFRNSHEESRPNKKQVLKNEAPDKLWPFVEQFCAIPTEEQIKELEEMIQAIDNDKDYFKVPALGKKESSSKDSPTRNDNNSPSKSQRKSKTRAGDEETSLGALTQRLVSSFIEESDDVSNDLTKLTNDSSQSSKKKNSKSKGGKSIDLNSAKNLEKRIRQELEEYDILDQQDEIPYVSEEDEILRELVASQHELLSVQRQNKDSMQRLLKKSKKHLELETEREKLREANADVIAAYQRLIQAKQRKRNPTKKERDVACKVLRAQETIFKKCDDLYLSNRNEH